MTTETAAELARVRCGLAGIAVERLEIGNTADQIESAYKAALTAAGYPAEIVDYLVSAALADAQETVSWHREAALKL